jgi:hypothetical protein
MQTRILKVAQVAVSVAVFATAFALPATAGDHSGDRRWHRHHNHFAAADRPLTVRSRYREPVLVSPDPYNGPAAIITAPVAFAGAVVGVPFRVIGTVFPAHGDPRINPLVLVGAPIHVAGQFAQFPFYVVDSAFGTPPNYY